MNENLLLPRVIFLSAYIPLFGFQKPIPFLESQQESLEAIGVKVRQFYVQGRGFLKYPKSILPLRRFIIETPADVLHAHYSFSGMLALSQRKLPIVLSLMGGDINISHISGCWSRLEAFVYYVLTQCVALAVNQVIVKSESMKQSLWRKRCIHVLPNGVNLDMFYPMDRMQARKTLGLELNKPYILFPGSRFRDVKDYPLAERVFQIVRSKFSDLEMFTLEAVPRHQVPLYLNAANAILFTSKSEGSPNVIKEAMACNIPVVTVDVGDTRKVVEDTYQCWVTSREPHEIAKRLMEVLSCGEPSNGRERIQPYDQRIMAQRMAEIYRLALVKPI